jgi:hypothetical protein
MLAPTHGEISPKNANPRFAMAPTKSYGDFGVGDGVGGWLGFSWLVAPY